MAKAKAKRKPVRRVPPVAPRKRRIANSEARDLAPRDPRRIGKDEAIAERRAKALELRKAGGSYRAIARALGVPLSTAWGDVQAELGALRDLAAKLAEDVRELELRRLDDWTTGLTPKARKGDHMAVNALVRIQERRARLLGIDAPTKIAPTEPDGSPLQLRSVSVTAALDRMPEELREPFLRAFIEAHREKKEQAALPGKRDG